jgi:hypothetical protein
MMEDKTKALDVLRAEVDIMARLAGLFPDNANRRRELVWFNRQLAELGQ